MPVKIFEATDENLEAVNDFIHEQIKPFSCQSQTLFQIDLAVEEIYVNIAHYAYSPDKGTVQIDCSVEKTSDAPAKLTVSFTDRGKAFNPLEKPDPDITLSVEEREIGGLGIFLTKKYMDSVLYERKDNQNILTFTKTIA
ncbi:MAG: ATP-binding protein [Treponema porcinum]|uniref:ATP-binding protein n=1 Tax=Treponema porcinum TaxID=261392 RepID=UPI00240A38FD|nr:ATP-binding protein [Treponema porcinum]MDD6898880.1 ATP-binding protein [Treponema porcinum]